MLKLLSTQTVPLFKPPHLLHLSICSFLCFGTFGVASGLSLFLPEVLNKMSKSQNNHVDPLKICEALKSGNITEYDNTTCDDSVDSSVFIDSAFVGLVVLAAFILISITIKPFGRRILFIITLLVSTISGVLLPLTTSQVLILTLYCLFFVLAGVNVSLINSAACELFPTHLRGMGVCIAMLFGRFGSVVSANFMGFMIEDHCALTINLYAGISFVCLLVSLKLPNTKKS